MLVKVFLSILVCSGGCFGARILGIVTTPSYSHQVAYHPLWKELPLRGHQVTLLTTDPIKDPSLKNLTQIDLSHMYNLYEITFKEESKPEPFKTLYNSMLFFDYMVKNELENREVKALIQDQKEHFDVVLAEGLELTMSYFSVRFNCPLIHIYSLEAYARRYRSLGSPSHPALDPDFMLPYSKDLNFLERLESFLYETYSTLLVKFVSNPFVDETVRKHFGEGYPSAEEMMSRVSLTFTNTDSVLHGVRPLTPNVVQIGGGTHLKPPNPLPTNLQNQLDSAKDGFVYFSLGSNVKSKYLHPKIIETFLQAFSQIPQLVLWKFEDDNLPGKPPNVIISKWLPQQDILRHPNIRLFITQGGLQSMEEAILSGVPMIGIPFMGDQPKNVRTMEHRGLGVGLSTKTFDKDILKKAIVDVIINPKYKNAVIKLSELIRDQPMTGLEKAVWWTEYVIRHKGAQHLKSQVLDIPWYQYYMLDIAAFIIVAAVVFVTTVKKIICISWKLVIEIFCISKKVKSN